MYHEWSIEDRVARMTVLAWHPSAGDPVNLFTMVRHRNRAALGPWEPEYSGRWENVASQPIDGQNYHGEIRLHCLDGTFRQCAKLVDRIVQDHAITIGDTDVHFRVEPESIQHWAYRDEMYMERCSVRSPFARHSAELTEYWGFNDDLTDLWEQLVKDHEKALKPLLLQLGLTPTLDERIDRIGNVMVAGAYDAIVASVSAGVIENALVLKIERLDSNAWTPGTYSATVRAGDDGNETVQKLVPLENSVTVIDLPSSIGYVGAEIYRNADGQRIYKEQAYLGKAIHLDMRIGSRDRINVAYPADWNVPNDEIPLSESRTSSVVNNPSAGTAEKITSAFRHRESYNAGRDNRRYRRLVRFEPEGVDEAAEFLLNLVSGGSGPNYLVDPYFTHVEARVVQTLVPLYVKMVGATAGMDFCILCDASQHQLPSYLTQLLDLPHVSVRSFHNVAKSKPAFHDRWLITPQAEYLMTNSINGWTTYGVTFVRLDSGVYRPQTEYLWAMPDGTNKDIEVKTLHKEAQ